MRIGTRRLLVAVRLDFDTSLSSDRIEQLSTRIDERLQVYEGDDRRDRSPEDPERTDGPDLGWCGTRTWLSPNRP